ncbi:AAA family ATPase [Rhodopirellula sp. SWK7]|uniref:cytidylate kinase-like family protein n=1 Tax=Rhodopirellula sp. SWK7 TaxID=595460 RepID=UPI0002BD7640|nr:cytidylate kinase-like family protein [Rhodopirellula sp. SWK7]EMI42044.1 cytidylate kinase [Rhodopirellula sp. SWK7]
MPLRIPAIEHKAESKILKWMQAEHTQNRLDGLSKPNPVGPFLALSRETGACGSEIAQKVAERLRWDLLDQEIVDFIEQHYGTPRCLIRRVDERHENWLSSIITSQIGGLGFSESSYTHRVAKLLLLAAAHGNVVIVGRGASFLLPRDRGLSVRVVAPIKFRIEQIMTQQGIGEKAARRFVIDSDRRRDDYIKDHFGENASDPHLYDVVLNVGNLSIDEAAVTIVDSISQRNRKSA